MDYTQTVRLQRYCVTSNVPEYWDLWLEARSLLKFKMLIVNHLLFSCILAIVLRKELF